MATPSDFNMDQFELLKRQYLLYPKCLMHHQTYPHSAEGYIARLAQRRSSLFCSESRACIDFWEYEDQCQGFDGKRVQNLDELSKLISGSSDPKARFIYIKARDSRAVLNISFEMLLLLFTHLQVMPTFLDFILTFGRRHYAQKFPSGGIRVEKRLTDASRGPILRQLSRSGHDYSLCYNLRTVEVLSKHEGWPWSIRQMAIYHSFDVITGRSVWIVVKANDLIEKRVREESLSNEHSEISTFDTNSQAFGASLAAHLIYTKCVSENWCWYLDFLEEKVESLTQRESIVPVESPRQIMSGQQPTFHPPTRVPTDLSFSCSIWSDKTLMSNDARLAEPQNLQSDPLDMASAGAARHLPRVPARETQNSRREHIDIGVLQQCQRLDEMAKETVQVITTNLSVLEALIQFYESITASDEFPEELKLGCSEPMEKMKNQFAMVIGELQMQRSRAESLSGLIRGRLDLHFGILEYCNLESSRRLAEEASLSAISVEHMTEDMHQIASKTKQETVSMRIITLVTLFFLPGTFVATLMGTDIIRWRSDGGVIVNKTVSTASLGFFFEVTAPVMVVTFAAWYALYWWASRKDRKASHAQSIV